VDRFLLQIVDRPDVADRAAFGPHQDGVGDRFVSDQLHPGNQRAVTDAPGTEKGTFGFHQIAGGEDERQFRFPRGEDFSPLRVIPGGHPQQHFAAESSAGRRR